MANGGTTGAAPPAAAIDALAERVRGAVIRPGDAAYDAARTVWNAMIDRRPAVVVRCTGAADVADAVDFAREHGLQVSVKAGGHNVAGTAVNDDGVVIDLSAMRGVHVDPGNGTVRVQGGATWGDCDRETQLFGLAVPGGVVSTTGVAGLTLHGGIGHLRRRYGLSIDNLISVDIVTADGRHRRSSQDEDAELFWAVRGAGSGFGVVTSFEFRAHEVGPIVAVAAVFYPLEAAGEVLPAWRDQVATAPDEMSSLALCWSVPAHEPFPPEHQGRDVVVIAAVWSGPSRQGEEAVRPLRQLARPIIDLSGPWPWVALQSGFDPLFPAGEYRYWKSHALPGLPDEAIEDVIDWAGRRPTPLSDIAIWHHGGAMGRVDPAATAYAGRDAAFHLVGEASWTRSTETDKALAWGRDVWKAMGRHSTGGLYLNFAGLAEDRDALLRAAYGPNHERLARLKGRYDPGNLFRSGLAIAPTA